MTYKEVLQFSEKITKRYGVNYYRATKFFPRRVRESVFLYYAWVRIADEYVDAQENQNLKAELLHSWIQDWQATLKDERDTKDIHWYMKKAFQQYSVPLEYGDDFLRAMSQDINQKQYSNYGELEEYMHGSAVVVGYTMLCFFGLYEKERLNSARSFAEAMQMTNFLRDIQEDFETLGRVYIPQDEMLHFGISLEDIKFKKNSTAWKNCMKFQIQRSRNLYKKAWVGIEDLPWRLKFPLRVAARKYEGILDEIEKADYDIWSKKHVLPSWKKKIITLISIFI